MDNKELIFVYNANSTIFAMVTDYAHKVISPDTYQCNLCKLTYGMTMKQDWKKYIESIPYKVSFLHRDEIKKQHPDLADTQLPAVFVKDESGMRLLVTHEELNKPKSIAELIDLMKQAISI